MALNTDRKRTQTVKKGGQTPEWDAELRFEVWQDMQDELQSEITATGGVRPAAAQDPAKQRANKANSASGKKVLNISVWADDPKDPDLVGDATVDLTEPLKLGEWDGAFCACPKRLFFFGTARSSRQSKNQNGSLSCLKASMPERSF